MVPLKMTLPPQPLLVLPPPLAIRRPAEAGPVRRVPTAALRASSAAPRTHRTNRNGRGAGRGGGNRRRANGARCNEEMLAPAFSEQLRDFQPLHVGAMEHRCEMCDALLFQHEVTASKACRGVKRGRSCCADGACLLPPIQPHTMLDALWTGEGQASKLLKEHARSFNNALALSFNEVEEPYRDSGRWQPSVIIQGKVYHRVTIMKIITTWTESMLPW